MLCAEPNKHTNRKKTDVGARARVLARASAGAGHGGRRRRIGGIDSGVERGEDGGHADGGATAASWKVRGLRLFHPSFAVLVVFSSHFFVFVFVAPDCSLFRFPGACFFHVWFPAF